MASHIPGIGPDAPTTTNSAGAKQSSSPYRLDLIPPLSLLDVAAVLAVGAAKYGVDNWRGIPVNDHLNHALVHIYAFLAGDQQDNHLGHACCRLMMAKEQEIKDKQATFYWTCYCGATGSSDHAPTECPICKRPFDFIA